MPPHGRAYVTFKVAACRAASSRYTTSMTTQGKTNVVLQSRTARHDYPLRSISAHDWWHACQRDDDFILAREPGASPTAIDNLFLRFLSDDADSRSIVESSEWRGERSIRSRSIWAAAACRIKMWRAARENFGKSDVRFIPQDTARILSLTAAGDYWISFLALGDKKRRSAPPKWRSVHFTMPHASFRVPANFMAKNAGRFEFRVAARRFRYFISGRHWQRAL